MRTGYHDFPSKIFWLRVPKDFSCGKLRCIRKVRLSKIFMPKRVISLSSVEFFHVSACKARQGIPLCFRIFGTSKTFMLSRGVSRFSFDFFDLTVLKNFVGNAFNFPEIFGYRNFLCMRTENHVLQSKIFVSQQAKNSWEPLLSFRIFGISETFMRITVFLRFFLSHSTEKFREEPSNVSKSFKCEVSKKILNKNGISRFSFENFSAQSAERFRCGTLRYVRSNRLSKNFMPRRVISLFSVEFFSRILPMKLGRESLFVSESLGHRRLLCSVAGYRDSPLIFLTSQY